LPWRERLALGGMIGAKLPFVLLYWD